MQTLIIFEYLHAATRANSRCYHSFQTVKDRYMASNPQTGHMKLVVIAWDSRHIPVPHSRSLDHQTSLSSTKSMICRCEASWKQYGCKSSFSLHVYHFCYSIKY